MREYREHNYYLLLVSADLIRVPEGAWAPRRAVSCEPAAGLEGDPHTKLLKTRCHFYFLNFVICLIFLAQAAVIAVILGSAAPSSRNLPSC